MSINTGFHASRNKKNLCGRALVNHQGIIMFSSNNAGIPAAALPSTPFSYPVGSVSVPGQAVMAPPPSIPGHLISTSFCPSIPAMPVMGPFIQQTTNFYLHSSDPTPGFQVNQLHVTEKGKQHGIKPERAIWNTKIEKETTEKIDTVSNQCVYCGVTDTPKWRKRIQDGKELILCNACGLKEYRRHQGKKVRAVAQSTLVKQPTQQKVAEGTHQVLQTYVSQPKIFQSQVKTASLLNKRLPEDMSEMDEGIKPFVKAPKIALQTPIDSLPSYPTESVAVNNASVSENNSQPAPQNLEKRSMDLSFILN